MKNYPAIGDLRADFAPLCTDIRIIKLKHFWALSAKRR